MRPARILVVDDNAGDARLTLEALREAAVGAEVTAVPDGEHANLANAYLVKPIGLDEFTQLVRSIDAFWLRAARLPER